MQKIKLGHRMLTDEEKESGEEIQCGEPVFLNDTHCVVCGLTQEAGKTTTLEKMSREAVEKQGKKVVVFLTKKGEGGFQQEGTRIKPYFEDDVDWEYVVQILETAMGKGMDFQEPWIINAVEADKYPFLDRAESLRDVWDNISELLTRHRDEEEDLNLKNLTESVYTSLEKYFEKVVPKIEEAELTTELKLEDGLNVMDLRHLDEELQSLIIGKTTEKIREEKTDTIEILPEAWKFLPQGSGSPCKDPVEKFIREAATQGNFLWIDSQDMTGMDKAILKQVSTWILGYQREKNEVERTRDQMPVPKRQAPDRGEVTGLGIGEFFLCDKNGVTKVYVDPIWINEIEINGKKGEDLAKAVACEEIESEEIKQARKDMDVEEIEPTALTPDGKMIEPSEEDTVEKPERERKEDKDKDTLEKKLSNLQERNEGLKQQIEDYEDTVEDQQERINQLKGELEDVQERYSELEDKVDNKDEEIQRLRNSLDSNAFEEDDTDEESMSPMAKRIKENAKPSSSSEDDQEHEFDAGYFNNRLDKIEEEIASLKEEDQEQPEVDESQIVEKVVDKVKDEVNTQEAPDSVDEMISDQMHQARIQDLKDKIEEYSNEQKKLLLFSETTGGRIQSKKKWVEGGLGWKGYGSKVGEEMDQLVKDGFVDKRDGWYYDNTKELIKENLSAFNPSEEEVEGTYQQLLADIKEEVDL